MTRRAAPVALAALAITLIASVGSSGAEVSPATCPPPVASESMGTTPPASSPAAGVAPTPEEILVCVSAQAITGATYAHWLTVAKKAEGPEVKGHHAATAIALQNEVLGFLISSDWVKGEAESLGISISMAEVRTTFDRIRHQEFRRGAFERFLRKSGQTVADLMFRVELNLLSERIQKRVSAGHRGVSSKERALARFVKAFKAKWQAQTYCASEYAVADCGHVQATV